MPSRQRQKLRATHHGRRRLRKLRATEADRLDEPTDELSEGRVRLGDALTEGVGENGDGGAAAATGVRVRARRIARKRVVLAASAVAGFGAAATVLTRVIGHSDGDSRRGP